MRPAAATALLGIGLLLVAATFDAEPLYVPGVGFLLLAALSAAWVAAGAGPSACGASSRSSPCASTCSSPPAGCRCPAA